MRIEVHLLPFYSLSHSPAAIAFHAPRPMHVPPASTHIWMARGHMFGSPCPASTFTSTAARTWPRSLCTKIHAPVPISVAVSVGRYTAIWLYTSCPFPPIPASQHRNSRTGGITGCILSLWHQIPFCFYGERVCIGISVRIWIRVINGMNRCWHRHINLQKVIRDLTALPALPGTLSVLLDIAYDFYSRTIVWVSRGRKSVPINRNTKSEIK